MRLHAREKVRSHLRATEGHTYSSATRPRLHEREKTATRRERRSGLKRKNKTRALSCRKIMRGLAVGRITIKKGFLLDTRSPTPKQL